MQLFTAFLFLSLLFCFPSDHLYRISPNSKTLDFLKFNQIQSHPIQFTSLHFTLSDRHWNTVCEQLISRILLSHGWWRHSRWWLLHSLRVCLVSGLLFGLFISLCFFECLSVCVLAFFCPYSTLKPLGPLRHLLVHQFIPSFDLCRFDFFILQLQALQSPSLCPALTNPPWRPTAFSPRT